MIKPLYRQRNFTISGTSVASYRIVYAGGQAELRAAVELREYIQKTCRVSLKVIRDTDESALQHEILIGLTNREDDPAYLIDRSGLGEEGFVIEERNGRLFITGAEPRGTLYGVYEFLEKFVGWRFLTADCEVLTCGDTVTIPEKCYDRQVPAFEYRDVHWYDYFKTPLRAKRKLNTGSKYGDMLDETYGGCLDYTGSFAHTFVTIAGLDNGTEQPCFSDPVMLEKTIAYVKRVASANPGARIISVTQNDNRNICQCEKCKQAYAEEGAPSGLLVRFINQVADAVRDEYPKLLIDTFAYQWSRKPPQLTKPRDNVLIRFCTGDECRIHGYGNMDCVHNQWTTPDIEKWGSISKHFFVWDYSGNFTYYLVPLANFFALRGDARFLYEKGATGLFNMGQYHRSSSDKHEGSNAEFGALRAYLLSKLFWNPMMDEEEYERHMNEFLAGYYGDGWSNIRQYIDFLVECAGDRHCRMYDGPNGLYDADMFVKNLPQIEQWFADAMELADFEQKDRLQLLKLHVDFLRLFFTWNTAMENEVMRQAAIRDNEVLWNELKKRGIHLAEQCRLVQQPDFTKSPVEWFIIPNWLLGGGWNIR